MIDDGLSAMFVESLENLGNPVVVETIDMVKNMLSPGLSGLGMEEVAIFNSALAQLYVLNMQDMTETDLFRLSRKYLPVSVADYARFSGKELDRSYRILREAVLNLQKTLVSIEKPTVHDPKAYITSNIITMARFSPSIMSIEIILSPFVIEELYLASTRQKPFVKNDLRHVYGFDNRATYNLYMFGKSRYRLTSIKARREIFNVIEDWDEDKRDFREFLGLPGLYDSYAILNRDVIKPALMEVEEKRAGFTISIEPWKCKRPVRQVMVTVEPTGKGNRAPVGATARE